MTNRESNKEAEPVAWRGRWSGDPDWHLSRSPRLIRGDDSEDYIQEPLFASPQQETEGREITEEMAEALKAAREVVKVAEALTSNRGDDDWIWGVLEKIDAALSKANAAQRPAVGG
jgi:hypothetical protein